MRRKGDFLKGVALTFGVVAVVSAYPIMQWGTPEVLWALVAGAVLSTLNVIAGVLAIEYAFSRSYTTFLKVVLGGMGVRLLVLLGMMLLLILVVRMHTVALTVSLLGFYAVYLVLEVTFIQRKFDAKNEG